MRVIDSSSPTNPLVAIGGDLRASLVVEPNLPDAINRLTAALDRAESAAMHLRLIEAAAASTGATKAS
jgi:hypothetical protein